MVAGEDRGTFGRDVLLSLNPGTEQQLEDRPENDRLEHPVEQLGTSPSAEKTTRLDLA